jgi:PKD repeat protein
MRTILSIAIFVSVGLFSHTQTSCDAFFTVSPGSQCNIFEFTDGSTASGNIVSWNYNFDDGTNTNLSDPNHMYISNDTYVVCLTITTDDNCTDQYCTEVTVDCLGTACYEPLLVNQSMICGLIYDPVCGCDNITYANACEATFFGGLNYYQPGECPNAGIKSAESEGISIYPNPTSSNVQISLDQKSELTIEIIDTRGQTIKVLTKKQSNEHIITLAEFEPGVYFLHLTTTEFAKTIRILKE